jgi:hydrophobic/amphiphilic exporter-1 (mainly G- bacteria), HAE1 family
MSLTELSVKRPTALFVLFTLLIGLGIMGLTRLGADLFPAADTPVVSVHSFYPGAGAEEIEKDLVKPLEDATSGLSGVDKIRSVSGEGYGYVLIQFTMRTKPDTAILDVQKAVDAMADTLPADATKPTVRKYDINAQPILIAAISGDVPYEELRARADDLKRSLENAEGVGQVTMQGAPEKELDVVVDRTSLEAYGIGLGTVIGLLKADNVSVPAGVMRKGGVERTVRVEGDFGSEAELRDLRVPLPRGGTVRLGELARIELAYPEDAHRARMNGRDAIGLSVIKSSDANVVETADRVKRILGEEGKALPSGMSVRIAADETVFITSSLSETFRDLLISVAVTAIVLFLFLRKIRSSLIVIVAIPTSLVSTFFMMYVCGFSLNIVSVMALALCIGILVDDSIVVLENIHRHRALGEDPVEASIKGRTEIGMAAIAITLCDVVVFAPVAFMNDIVGQFFKQFGLTVVFATLFSLLVSFTLTPSMASRLLARERTEEGGGGKTDGFFERDVKGAYRRALDWALGHRAVVLAAVGLLFAASVALVPLKAVSTEFLPPFDQGKLVIDMNLGAGAGLGRTDAAVKQTEAKLLGLPEVQDIYSLVGTDSGSNYANIAVRLKPARERKKSQSALANELRGWAAGLAGMDVSVTESSIVAQTSIEGKKPLIINIAGPDRKVLASLAARAEQALKATPGAVDIENSLTSRKTEVTIALDRLALSEYGLTAADAATSLRAALSGAKAGVYRRSGDEYDVVVKIDPDQARSVNDLASLRVASPSGALVEIGQVARLGREDAPSSLERRDRSNVATVQANLQGRPLGSVVADARRALDATPLPRGYQYLFTGDTSNMTDSFASLAWALGASIALVFLVLVLLYESFLTPIIRMLSLPAGIIGGFAAFAITGKSINIISFIGIIMLDGLISKNGTLLIDYTNTLVKRGLTLRDALVEAGLTRLRPIIMTSSTMIVGMLPLALSSGASSEIKSGMAVVLIGGLITSTLISPILLPVAYTVIDDARNRRRERRERRAGRREARS